MADREISHQRGICSVAERLNDDDSFGIEMCLHEYRDIEIDLMIESFQKVWNNLDHLR